MGDDPRGFEAYEWRWKLDRPAWDGVASIADKIVLNYDAQRDFALSTISPSADKNSQKTRKSRTSASSTTRRCCA
ncbi:MAG: hypothetical protein SFV21_14055 [Rhodospirillaceae bacterium]|nr:hypothetical protein [Rhodospirillaceae bacterium]